jgi:hypothetical protein
MSDFIRQATIKKTRKFCVCSGCARQMPVGSTVDKVWTREADGIFESVWCRVCQKFADVTKMLPIDYETMSFGDFRACEREIWEALRIEVES